MKEAFVYVISAIKAFVSTTLNWASDAGAINILNSWRTFSRERLHLCIILLSTVPLGIYTAW